MEMFVEPFDLMAAIKKGRCFTLDGRQVFLTCVLCDGSKYPVQGVVLDHDLSTMRSYSWTLQGRFVDVLGSHNVDLVNDNPIL